MMESIRHRHASRAAAEVLNLYWDLDEPKAVVFGRVMWTILAAMEAAAGEAHEARTGFSDN